MRQETVPTYWASIYIAGSLEQIQQTCREFCLDGFCVTVTPTKYIYTHGEESGAIIGLINYPRFPSTPDQIEEKAEELGIRIMDDCCQGSFTVMTQEKTTFFSRKERDDVKTV